MLNLIMLYLQLTCPCSFQHSPNSTSVRLVFFSFTISFYFRSKFILQLYSSLSLSAFVHSSLVSTTTGQLIRLLCANFCFSSWTVCFFCFSLTELLNERAQLCFEASMSIFEVTAPCGIISQLKFSKHSSTLEKGFKQGFVKKNPHKLSSLY